MKKHITMLTILLCACCLLYSCSYFKTEETASPDPSPTHTAEPSPTPSSDPAVTIHPEYGELPVHLPGSIRLDNRETDDFSFTRKYRTTYYNIWGAFTVGMLSEEQWEVFDDWFLDTVREFNHEKDQTEMLLVSLIKHFDVTREQFDSAVEHYVEQCTEDGWDMKYEEYEVPNGDIIYTFDNEIINEYYRYE
ncbi:MAG TPA: hypothetical protein VFD33_05900 [Bacillota bacterium]|nr:hypothetical protein [Bacillota bacterium]